ncbi:hypothetical protein [Paraburkholderia sp. C35]|uniref:AbiU2 domain-containing protein n=1 Tax=Paraburkholderia sp. C35 TaxID=2126993 RepID=UPI001EF6F150|nr:hypothetical protein [Paraburkholderia sp. C35]
MIAIIDLFRRIFLVPPMPTQIEKLQAYAGHLLDAFIGLKERYAMLEPMLFDQGTIEHSGTQERARGFLILRHSLFLSCAQDIAKLTLDNDQRTPSIRNIVAGLEDESLRQKLEAQYSIWTLPSVEEETDPEIVAALRHMEKQERLERRDQFLEHYTELRSGWATLSTSESMKSFLAMRDKLSAHTEVRCVADKYQLLEISALGIKWRHLRETIESMQRLVELIGFIVRNAGFAWDSLDHQLSKAAKSFWNKSSELN